MTRIAIPLVDNKLSEHFGKCSMFKIFEIDNKTITDLTHEFNSLTDNDKIFDWVVKNKITDVITYKIDKQLINLIGNTKIYLFVGVAIESTEVLIERYLNGTLTSDTGIINFI